MGALPITQPGRVVSTHEARKRLQEALAAVIKASDARWKLEPGSPRARVTTANARWRAACEEWDRTVEWAHEQGFTELPAQVRREVEHANS